MAAVVLGCTGGPQERPLDTPTSGSIRIAVDESLRPLLAAEVNAFTSIYRKADIRVDYVSESEAVDLLLKDSVRLVVLTRPLSADERRVITAQKITPTDVTVAREGIALICNKDNPDTVFEWNDLVERLSGVKGKGQDIVFDHPSSGIVRYLMDSVLHADKLPANWYALKSNEAVINHVSTNKGAMGLIGASWISDSDDTTTHRFLKIINVIGVGSNGKYYQPYQAYIAQHLYPLTRDIIISSREPRSGLGSGFMSFVAGDKGQRIALKSGLVPATMPLRIVEINHEPF
jgi:phosphate transport system substrate-binding protein